MRWTRDRSRRALAAKAARRLAPAEPAAEPARRTPIPRGSAGKWSILIRDLERGDRLQITLHRTPWGTLTDAGGRSPTQVCRALRAILTHAA